VRSRRYGSDVMAGSQRRRPGGLPAPGPREVPQLEPELLGRVEELIDFVTVPGSE
jgi:hypothetical protein